MGLAEIQAARELWLSLFFEQLLALDDDTFAAGHIYMLQHCQPSEAERQTFRNAATERARHQGIATHVY